MGQKIQIMKIIAAIPSLRERTAELCKHLVAKQVNQVVMIEGLGRNDAIRECWKAGVGSDVLVTLASDVLIYPGTVQVLLKQLKNKVRASAICRSKFRNVGRGGLHIYNGRYLQELIDFTDKKEFQDYIRPEADTLKHFNHVQLNGPLTGLHEYELDYKEIYDRYCFQTVKHARLIKNLIPNFKKMVDVDDDYKAVWQAINGQPFDMGTKTPINDFEKLIEKYQL